MWFRTINGNLINSDHICKIGIDYEHEVIYAEYERNGMREVLNDGLVDIDNFFYEHYEKILLERN